MCTSQITRELMQIIFKSKASIAILTKSIIIHFESAPNILNPKRTSNFINLVQVRLQKFNISASEFITKLLLKIQ